MRSLNIVTYFMWSIMNVSLLFVAYFLFASFVIKTRRGKTLGKVVNNYQNPYLKTFFFSLECLRFETKQNNITSWRYFVPFPVRSKQL